jgi:hypothetical protein
MGTTSVTPSTLPLVDGVPVKVVSGHGVVDFSDIDPGGADVVELLPLGGRRVGEVDDVEDLGAAPRDQPAVRTSMVQRGPDARASRSSAVSRGTSSNSASATYAAS